MLAQYLVKDGHCGIRQPGMRNPRAVVAVVRFQRFIRFHFGKDLIVAFNVFARDKRRHTAHRERAALVTGFDQQARVGAQKRFVHRYHLPVRQDAIRVIFQRFDIAENIIPTTTVETDDMITQRMKNLIHLENSRQRFNQQGRFDRTARQVKAVFGVAENFTPPGLLPARLAFSAGKNTGRYL